MPVPASGFSLKSKRFRWWWYLGVPAGLLLGAVLAVWLRTSPEDAGVLRRGTLVDMAFTRSADPPLAAGVRGDRSPFLLVMFGYSHCPDVCPTTLVAIQLILSTLGARAEAVAPIFVTVDPQRDTPELLKAFVGQFDTRIHIVAQADAALLAMQAFRARAIKRPATNAEDYAVDHTAVLYVLDPEHRVIGVVPEVAPPMSVAQSTIAALERSAAFPRAR
jgi:protein SCO1